MIKNRSAFPKEITKFGDILFQKRSDQKMFGKIIASFLAPFSHNFKEISDPITPGFKSVRRTLFLQICKMCVCDFIAKLSLQLKEYVR